MTLCSQTKTTTEFHSQPNSLVVFRSLAREVQDIFINLPDCSSQQWATDMTIGMKRILPEITNSTKVQKPMLNLEYDLESLYM